MTLAALSDIYSYKNENVVHRFSEDYNLSISDAEEIFLETKKWLWLCAKRKWQLENKLVESFQIPLFNEALAIDLMWHTFILHTEDYADFCQQYFGHFIHHRPKPKSERLDWLNKIAVNEDAAWRERREHLKKVYSYFYDELGPETLIKWCEEFPKRFNSRLKL